MLKYLLLLLPYLSYSQSYDHYNTLIQIDTDTTIYHKTFTLATTNSLFRVTADQTLYINTHASLFAKDDSLSVYMVNPNSFIYKGPNYLYFVDYQYNTHRIFLNESNPKELLRQRYPTN